MKIFNLNGFPAYCIPDAALIVGSAIVYNNRLEEGYIANKFDERKELLQEEVTSRLTRREVDGGIEFFFIRPPTLMGHFNAKVFQFNTIHPYNYYHFLIESLPGLYSFLRSGDLSADSLILTGQLHPNMQTALSFVLAGKIPLLQLGLWQYITAAEVVTGEDTVYGAELLDGKLSDEFFYRNEDLLLLRDLFKKSNHYKKKVIDKKIFVKRYSPQRQLFNSRILEKISESNGFEVVDPGELSFWEQVELFSSASVVCGPTGAWVANMIFAPENAKFFIFYPETAITKKTLWAGLGEVLSVDVEDIYCPISILNNRQPIHSHFNFPENDFRKLLIDIDRFVMSSKYI
jgi:hypothetical protein